ncbi:hypothetical protein [Lysobacter enzymogenes]|uniref:hypothetical protein n=1 Tax=Lysobacter enzymogenes TaxID=69 RepID=UPI001AFBC82C|nr:hypothetical protein [Lysobacter enzymogenes]QQQ00734.1 hypothetical protein JHW41_22105 [Lysobacter enzymogenes]
MMRRVMGCVLSLTIERGHVSGFDTNVRPPPRAARRDVRARKSLEMRVVRHRYGSCDAVVARQFAVATRHETSLRFAIRPALSH